MRASVVWFVLCSTAAASAAPAAPVATAANATAAAAPASAAAANAIAAAERRRLSTASFLRAHPDWRPPPPSPPPLDSLTGEELDAYLASVGVADTQLSSTGLDGAALEELLKVGTPAAIELLQTAVPSAVGKYVDMTGRPRTERTADSARLAAAWAQHGLALVFGAPCFRHGAVHEVGASSRFLAQVGKRMAALHWLHALAKGGKGHVAKQKAVEKAKGSGGGGEGGSADGGGKGGGNGGSGAR